MAIQCVAFREGEGYAAKALGTRIEVLAPDMLSAQRQLTQQIEEIGTRPLTFSKDYEPQTYTHLPSTLDSRPLLERLSLRIKAAFSRENAHWTIN